MSDAELIAFHADGWPDMRLVPADRWREWMNDTRGRFANRCLPLLVANEAGWVLLNPSPFQATWNGDESADGMTIEFAGGSAENTMVGKYFGYGVVTWDVPYLFRTPPGYNLLVRGPANWPKDGACALEGLVETDWVVATFTMNWKLTRPNHPVTFEADEPICMVVPQRRGELESFAPGIRDLESDPATRDGFRQWFVNRHLMIAEKRLLWSRGKPEAADRVWEPDYFRGMSADGTRTADHDTKLRLRPFEGPPE